MKFRKILAMVMALALLCATFTACGDTSGTSSSAGTSSTASETGDSSAAEEGETATGGSGGTLNMRNTMEPTSLNTLLATYAYDFTPINAMIECLYRDDENDVPLARRRGDCRHLRRQAGVHLPPAGGRHLVQRRPRGCHRL